MIHSKTITEEETKTPLHLLLTLKGPVVKKLEKVLQKTAEAIESLPKEYCEEVTSQVNKWEKSFFDGYKVVSKNDALLKNEAHKLLFLGLYLENVMENYAEKSDDEKVKWIIISYKIKKIVAIVLPKNLDLERFIETDRKKQLEIQLRYKVSLEIEDIMEIINLLFDDLENKIYEDADALLDQMETCFKNLKGQLEELNQHQQKDVEHLHGELDKITESVSGIYQGLKTQIDEIQDLDKEVRATDDLLEQIRNELEALVNKI